MRWAIVAAAAAVAAMTAGCSQTRETALVPAAGQAIVAVPVIDAEVFPPTVLEQQYRRRLAEQPPLPLGNRNSYTYYQRTVTRY